jgi:hypothetical protein
MGLFSKEEPTQVVVRTGDELTCRVCDFDRFFERKGQINTAVASFFDFDWANPTAECKVCARCGYVHWFLGT